MRSPAPRALLALAVVAFGGGCQDYNFNPVGKCLIQPATERVTLSDLSSADVLFVVDDSGSMAGEQEALAAAFGSFVTNLDDYNQSRVDAGLEPFDFHLAVTSTSTMWNPDEGLGATCRSDCAGQTGNLVCCAASNAPLLFPNRCNPGTCADGYDCRTDCPGLLGESYCCNTSDEVQQTAVASCTTPGAKCGVLSTHYENCTAGNRGNAVNGTRYPQGDFVSLDGQPRVLHFDKSLYQGGTGLNRQGFTRAELIGFFQNSVKVGTCGSGQETALAAARLAVEKALAGQQKDTYDLAGNPTWNGTTRIASSTAEWPRDGAKLVLVFVGDEDDCSSPIDPATGVVWDSRPPGQDACSTDSALPEGSRRLTPFGEYVNYFMGLGRPVGAAFVVSMVQDACGRAGTGSCSPGICCGNCGGVCTSTCGAQAGGYRLFDAAQGLRGRGADVFSGSICDDRFDLVLGEIANVVRPPAGLALPSTPAESVVTLLRIADREGQTRKICRGPAPTTLVATEAAAAGWDWWFTETRDPGDPFTVSRYVYINQTSGACLANPGETYSADYIGRLPADGCATRASCRNALGGQTDDWACVDAASTGTGTCICCAAGSTDPCCTGVGTAEQLAACRL